MTPSLVIPLFVLAAMNPQPATPHVPDAAQDSAPAATAPSAAPREAVGFLYKTVTVADVEYAYSVYVPPEYTPDKSWPVILFLHGSGERGSDGLIQTEVGMATAIRRRRALCPAIVVMPQCRAGARWADAMNDMALKCLEQTSREYHLDPQRLYLTGLSMGGEGAWLIAMRYPDRFAAVAPLCGFAGNPTQPPTEADTKKIAETLKNTPVWAFHGGADKNVIPQHSQAIVAALKAAGGNAQLTEYPNVEHNCWDRTYGNPEFWKWLLAQRLPPK